MKKTLAIILALVMVFALCACGQQAASGSANQSVSQQGSAGSPKQDIADATPVGRPVNSSMSRWAVHAEPSGCGFPRLG